MIVLEIRDMGRPPGGNELKALHYRDYKKVRDEWQMRLMVERVPEIPTPCTLTMTVFSSNKMDLDNVAACAKVPLDCLQRLGKLKDDSSDHITELVVRHEKCKRKDAGVRLEFTL